MGDLVNFKPKLVRGERPRKHLAGCESGDFGPCRCDERRKANAAKSPLQGGDLSLIVPGRLTQEDFDSLSANEKASYIAYCDRQRTRPIAAVEESFLGHPNRQAWLDKCKSLIEFSKDGGPEVT